MNKKTVLITLVITLLGLYFAFEYHQYEKKHNVDKTRADIIAKSHSHSETSLQGYPPHIQQFYNELPILFWSLDDSSNPTPEQVRAELARIMREIGKDRATFIVNKFMWLTDNLPVTRKGSEVTYNPTKLSKFKSVGRMSHELTKNEALHILSLPINDAIEKIDAIYKKSQLSLNRHLINQALTNFVSTAIITSDRFPDASPLEIEEHAITEFTKTDSFIILQELAPNINLRSYFKAPDNFIQQYQIDQSRLPSPKQGLRQNSRSRHTGPNRDTLFERDVIFGTDRTENNLNNNEENIEDAND